MRINNCSSFHLTFIKPWDGVGGGGEGDAQTKNHSVEGVWIYFLEQHNPDVKILLTDLFASLVTLKDALTL